VRFFKNKKIEYIEEFKSNALLVRKTKGCLEYEILIDSADIRFDNKKRKDVVILYEK